MELEKYNFHLPKKLIAQQPTHPRDMARLLVYDRKKQVMIDDVFRNIDSYLVDNSVIVVNNSKVEKCRLRIGNCEIFVLGAIDDITIKAMVKPGKKFRVGEPTVIAGLRIDTVDIYDDGIRILKFDRPLDHPSLDEFRLTPLPPYIAQNENLSQEYQTVYAKPLGSKAAPTAGLHFTPQLMKSLKLTHKFAEITLHVGLGTFAPIKGSITDHKMHSEEFEIDAVNAHIINSATHITAVGTTTARTLESIQGPIKATNSSTDIFIQPGHQFRHVDSLITNFHLPKSTLLMLVAAFMGSVDEMQRVYQYAIANDYRFYSFGDAMLIV